MLAEELDEVCARHGGEVSARRRQRLPPGRLKLAGLIEARRSLASSSFDALNARAFTAQYLTSGERSLRASSRASTPASKRAEFVASAYESEVTAVHRLEQGPIFGPGPRPGGGIKQPD